MTDLLTTKQVQALLQLDRTTIYRMVDGGHLPAVRVGKQWRFVAAEIEHWLRQRSPRSPAAPAVRAGSLERRLDFARTADAEVTAVDGTTDLRNLLPSSSTQSIQSAFADVLGVMMVITDMQGRPVTEVSNPCGFFSILTENQPMAVEHCIRGWQQLAGLLALEPKFAVSEMGLLCARGLIRVGTELKGMVVVGGIAPDVWPPAAEQVNALAEKFGVEQAAVLAGIDAVYRLDRAGQTRVLSFVQRIADVFSEMVQEQASHRLSSPV